MPGTLFIVATPIGNLEDITLRALSTLKSVDLILAEDTRVTQKLLAHYEIKKPLETYNQHSFKNPVKLIKIISNLQENQNIALVTDAGTPGISDPGNELVSYISQANPDIKIIPIPGPSSLTAALSVSGMDASQFMFIGFWPKKKTKKLIETIKATKLPMVFFDSPFRITKTLNLLEKEFPQAQISVFRELTKLHETIYRSPIKEVKPKGEIVVILKP